MTHKHLPYPADYARDSEQDRAAMFVAVFRIAINRGFYPTVFENMDHCEIMQMCVDYIVNGRELLTIFDPHFLECLYGGAATRKAHWLMELRMRRMDVVPALHRDVTTRIRVVEESSLPDRS